MKQTVKLSVLLYQSNGHWIAQCIEYDVAAQAKSIPAVVEAFQWTFYAQVLRDPTLSTIDPAPQEFKTQFSDPECVPLGAYPVLPAVAEPAPTIGHIEEEFRVFSQAA